MNSAEALTPTLWSIGYILAGGGVLMLLLARFDLRQIVDGEMGARYVGWLLLLPLYLTTVFVGGMVALLLLGICIGILVVEFARAARLTEGERELLLQSGLLTLLTAKLWPAAYPLLPTVALLLLTLWPIWTNDIAYLTERLWKLSWGYLYTIWALGHAVLLWALPMGQPLLVAILAGCGLADVGAYSVGKAVGRHPIAPTISPNKAWEGLIGNLLGAGLGIVLFRFLLLPFSFMQLAALVLTIGLGSAWGDLLSSLAKRSAARKDWGNLLPGHGGLLDRLNSLIVVLPTCYYLLRLWMG
ncbi:MAG: phosphatidate cytidylyltransferase [Anaerolineales bacterium]|nr:phosphatidate cytidylyltransferase [Anaerolineales bacterium]MCB9126722.1 phosphatidate cytidylyltransferase [Ardenticatenales bacterium]MCB9171736.1 phosphatidate cytidylyltransferase [Ardenticatenales bacterium]